MERARRHQRGLARLALLLLALVAELSGRSLAERLDFGRHVEAPYSGAQYYPISDFPRLQHIIDTQYKYVVTIDRP